MASNNDKQLYGCMCTSVRAVHAQLLHLNGLHKDKFLGYTQMSVKSLARSS